MATATVTFTTEDDEPNTLGITIDFDPDFKNAETESNPLCHQAAFLAVEAVGKALALDPLEST